MSNMSSKEMISRKAFAVYCDEIARQAAERNDKIRAKNDLLEASRALLTSLKVTSQGKKNVLYETSLLPEDNDQARRQESSVVYDVDQSSCRFRNSTTLRFRSPVWRWHARDSLQRKALEADILRCR